MKHHKISKLINDLTATAIKHKDCQSLREALKDTLSKYVNISDDTELTMLEEWLLDYKTVLEQALKDIYANRGEDKFIEETVNTALRNED